MTEPVRLENIGAFRKALHNYRVSAHAQKVLDDSRLVVMSGVAGGGRNAVITHLVEQYNYFFLVSDTTRPPKFRSGVMEQDGVHYYFRTEADMLRDIQNGESIEAEIIHNQQVSGTSIRELARANETQRTAVHDFEFGGARNIAAAKPDAYIIGLLPPSYGEWIRRLRGREEMHQQEFVNRLETAEKVLQNMLGEPYFNYVINDTISQCVSDVRDIVEGGTIDAAQQQEAHRIATELLQQVQEHLKTLKIHE